MVVAKTDEAYEGLVEAFQERRVEKTYYAICRGVIRQKGTIDTPIGRDPKIAYACRQGFIRRKRR